MAGAACTCCRQCPSQCGAICPPLFENAVSIQAKSDHQDPSKPLLKRLWTYLRPELTAFILSMVAMGVVAATEGIIPKVVKDLLDQGFGGEYAGKLWQVPAMLVGIAVVRGVAQFASTYLLSLVSNKVLLNLR